MLGLGHHNRWQWKAAGKHPSAADYIVLGNGSPLIDALAQWMSDGFGELQQGGFSAGARSWRFWLRAGQKESLVCGVVRDSSDRIGRPFPLMVAGYGSLLEWERRWPRLPRGLERTWSQMERLAVHRFEDLAAMNAALKQLTPPGELERGLEGGAPAAPPQGGDWHTCGKDLAQTGRAVLALETLPGADAELDALSWHAGLQSCCSEIPRAVFMGGSPRRIYLAAMLKPLTAADFVTLWSIPS